jgi:NitT/TauT family transport system permease protein
MNARQVRPERYRAAPVTLSTPSEPTMNEHPKRLTAAGRSRRTRRLLKLLEQGLAPFLVVAFFLGLWEALVRQYAVPLTLLPPPSFIYSRLVETWPTLIEQAVPTTLETVISFVLATVTGVVLAVLLTYSRFLNSAFYPLIVFFQLIPKIALAPLFVVWMGIGSPARIEFSAFMAFFPVVVSTMAGFRGTPPDMLRLCRGLTANAWQVFTLVRLPYAVSHIFSGMKVAVTLAMIGIIVAEFISAQKGLGYLIVFASSQADTALILAAIFILCVIGLALYAIVVGLEYLARRRYG